MATGRRGGSVDGGERRAGAGRRAAWAPCAVAALLATGCLSSQYRPRTPGRVALMMEDNKVVLVRDGRSHEIGFFGGGLASAVEGVPAAEAAAEEFSARRKSGTLIIIGGTLCAGVALGFMTHHAVDDTSHDDAIFTEALLATGCLIGSYYGVWRLVSAEPYKYDAINLFNDAAALPPASRPSSWDAPP